jgi:centrosomal protein CEP290
MPVLLAVEKRSIPDSEYQRWTEGVITQLVDAQRALDAVLKEVQAAGEAGGAAGPMRNASGAVGARSMAGSGYNSHGQGMQGGPVAPEYAGLDAGFLADAMADELRERLKEMARQVVDLQVSPGNEA